MNRNMNRWCAVPQCYNTSMTIPTKLFIRVPTNQNVRTMWLNLAGRDPATVSAHSKKYFCEDHFDLPNDMENYMKYHVMGSVLKVRMKSGCNPTRFECQLERRPSCARESSAGCPAGRDAAKTEMIIVEVEPTVTEENQEAVMLETTVPSKEMLLTVKTEPVYMNEERVDVKIEPVKFNEEQVIANNKPEPVNYEEVIVKTEKVVNEAVAEVIVKIEPMDASSYDIDPVNESRVKKETVVKTEPQSVLVKKVTQENQEEVVNEHTYEVPVVVMESLVREKAVTGTEGGVESWGSAVPAQYDVHDVLAQDCVKHKALRVAIDGSREQPPSAIRDPQTGQKRYFCKTCEKVFTRLDSLSSHILLHRGIKPYTCDICQKDFASSSHLTTHKRLHTKHKPYTCEICFIAFAVPSHLKRHKVIHFDEKTHFCEICKKGFKRRQDVKVHIVIHSEFKPYTCDICKRDFTVMSTLKTHMQLHNEVKQAYACKICKKSFAELHYLKRHERIHTGAKPFSCEICSKRFTALSSLGAHKRIHTGQRPYSCEICELGFKIACDLKKHKRIHTKEKPYSCQICNKTFARSCNLRVHERSHTGVKPYSCEVCQKSFRQLDHLKKHLRIHDGHSLNGELVSALARSDSLTT